MIKVILVASVSLICDVIRYGHMFSGSHNKKFKRNQENLTLWLNFDKSDVSLVMRKFTLAPLRIWEKAQNKRKISFELAFLSR